MNDNMVKLTSDEQVAASIGEEFVSTVPLIIMNNNDIDFSNTDTMDVVFSILIDYYCLIYGVHPEFVRDVLLSASNSLLNEIHSANTSVPGGTTIN